MLLIEIDNISKSVINQKFRFEFNYNYTPFYYFQYRVYRE